VDVRGGRRLTVTLCVSGGRHEIITTTTRILKRVEGGKGRGNNFVKLTISSLKLFRTEVVLGAAAARAGGGGGRGQNGSQSDCCSCSQIHRLLWKARQ